MYDGIIISVLTPSPSPPRIKPARFVLPRTPSKRAERRPFYQYTLVLNSIDDEEWERLCLPSPDLHKHQPNTQLYGLPRDQALVHVVGGVAYEEYSYRGHNTKYLFISEKQ